ncbi:hypothetical protein OIO89_01150 (plasmid) [Mycobacterium ulcerans]|nr:hypothetical protein OIO89_01150 [Mycobacterium ulcerans]
MFVFPGQGSQYPGMGADLYRQFPCSPTPSTRRCGAEPFISMVRC